MLTSPCLQNMMMQCNRHYVAVRQTPFKTISWLSLHFINRTIFQLVLQLTEFTWNKDDNRIALSSLSFIFLKQFTANLLKMLWIITFDIRVPCCLQMPLIKIPLSDYPSKLEVDSPQCSGIKQLSTTSKKISHGLTIIWLVKTSCRQTSLHPGLSTSWCVLACSGWPAFTGFRTTLSPITTCIQMEQPEPQKVN